ncbi:MAG: hypothetical protein WC476_00875 [Phycisphaerae bacterium]|jgi:hypothetical protein
MRRVNVTFEIPERYFKYPLSDRQIWFSVFRCRDEGLVWIENLSDRGLINSDRIRILNWEEVKEPNIILGTAAEDIKLGNLVEVDSKGMIRKVK